MYYQITIDKIDEVSDYELIETLNTFGFNGVEENDTILNVYFEEGVDVNTVKQFLEKNNRSYTVMAIPDKNWNAVWESNFEPVLVDDFCYIKAPFHKDLDTVKHTIHITPKMSFGTGHHATTYQMIAQMQKINFTNKSVLDFGTGTGILAILAKKMNALEVTAIDIDDWSVENAKENAANNNCNVLVIFKASIGNIKPEIKFDIILANINRHILLENMNLMKQFLSHDGKLLLSGILKEDLPIITTSLAENGLKIENESVKDNWMCIVATKHKN